jgi:hypothetical protein
VRILDLLRNQRVRPKAHLPQELVKDFQKWLSSPAFDVGTPRHQRQRTGSFYPSKWGDCDRSMALEFLKAPQNFVAHDPRLKITFEFGNALHESLQKLFRRHAEHKGWEFLDEVRITRDSNPWFVSGRIDGVHYRPMEDRRSSVEFKSINDSGFASLWNGPLNNHLTQGNLYLGLAPYSIDEMHYIYVNKNTSAMKEFVRPFDKGLFRHDLKRIEKILHGLQGNRLPVCHKCTPGCPFYDINCELQEPTVRQLADPATLEDIKAFKPRFLRVLTSAA